MPGSAIKSAGAFRTIGEVADLLGIQQHILRYWETRFPQLRPVQRAGKRRYYRPDDVALVSRINRLLNQEGYTVKGVQKLLATGGAADQVESEMAVVLRSPQPGESGILPALTKIHARLAKALMADEVASRL